jgi:mycothiol synthase
LSLPEGFRFRDVDESDGDTAARILEAAEENLRGRAEWGAPDIDVFWRRALGDGRAWIVETGDGEAAAFAMLRVHDAEAICWAAVHPDFRGRGIATAVLAHVEAEARRSGARQLKVGTFVEDASADELFRRLGYHEERHFFHMRLDLDKDPPLASWPPGISVSPFRPEDARAFHSTLGEAFADEWGFMSVPFEEWKRTRLEAPNTDTSLWFVARDGDEIAGVARCNLGKDGGGWIGALGVRKPWRERGIGLALLRHAFAEFQRRGESHVNLGVDAENPTGATRLYERAGMRVLNEDVVYGKELA